MTFYLILVSWTWFPRGWWTLSFGRLRKALGRTAQVRPLLPLCWAEPLLRCRAERGAARARALGSLRGVWVQFTVCSDTCGWRARPDCWRPPRGSAPWLLCQTRQRGWGWITHFPPSWRSTCPKVWLTRKQRKWDAMESFIIQEHPKVSAGRRAEYWMV